MVAESFGGVAIFVVVAVGGAARVCPDENARVWGRWDADADAAFVAIKNKKHKLICLKFVFLKRLYNLNSTDLFRDL